MLLAGVIVLTVNGFRDTHRPTASSRANRSPDPSELQSSVPRMEQAIRCVCCPRNSQPLRPGRRAAKERAVPGGIDEPCCSIGGDTPFQVAPDRDFPLLAALFHEAKRREAAVPGKAADLECQSRPGREPLSRAKASQLSGRRIAIFRGNADIRSTKDAIGAAWAVRMASSGDGCAHFRAIHRADVKRPMEPGSTDGADASA